MPADSRAYRDLQAGGGTHADLSGARLQGDDAGGGHARCLAARAPVLGRRRPEAGGGQGAVLVRNLGQGRDRPRRRQIEALAKECGGIGRERTFGHGKSILDAGRRTAAARQVRKLDAIPGLGALRHQGEVAIHRVSFLHAKAGQDMEYTKNVKKSL